MGLIVCPESSDALLSLSNFKIKIHVMANFTLKCNRNDSGIHSPNDCNSRDSRSNLLQLTKKILLQAIPGVPKITEGHNPATWMLEVSSPSVEARMNVDFAEIYSRSSLYQ